MSDFRQLAVVAMRTHAHKHNLKTEFFLYETILNSRITSHKGWQFQVNFLDSLCPFTAANATDADANCVSCGVQGPSEDFLPVDAQLDSW